MAFVNKQSGDEAADELAGSGQLLDFDPYDPDIVKVHYDVSAWSVDQRAELTEALAERELPHSWDGDEVVVPESVEAQVDLLFDELEQVLGPFPVLLGDEDPATEFGLDEWTPEDRAVLTDALIEAEVPHRWHGTTIFVAADAEDAVDDLLDAIEAGELLSAGDDHEAPPEGALGAMFLLANRLAKDPADVRARRELLELQPLLDAKRPPFGMAQRPWARAVGGIGTLAELVNSDATSSAEGVESDMIGAAQDLRTVLRPYV